MITRRAVAALATLAVTLAGCSSGARHDPSPAKGGAPQCTAPAAGRHNRLPDLQLACLGSGPAVDVARLAGPAVVNLWASWCYPCRQEMPLLQRAHGSVRVIGVNTNDAQAAALRFLPKVGATYEQLSDPTGRLATALHAPGLPYTVAIDAAGAIVWHKAGVMAASDVAAAVRAARRKR